MRPSQSCVPSVVGGPRYRVRGLSAPPRPPTPPNWDDEGLEGEGVGEAGEVEELMKCHGFLLDTLRLAQV